MSVEISRVHNMKRGLGKFIKKQIKGEKKRQKQNISCILSFIKLVAEELFAEITKIKKNY